MFPNPQAALPLQSRPSIEHYRKLAKDLVKAARSPDAGALVAFAERWTASLWRALAEEHQSATLVTVADAAQLVADFARRHFQRGCNLGEAQFVIARAHGFVTWAAFVEHLDRLTRGAGTFEAAADAVIAGDEPRLRVLLAADAKLTRAKSDREHGATLLIYTSANGVESYRQRTPANIVRIAELLLDAGADLEATANVYGGACTTLGLVATSAHPRAAGVQLPLMQLLIDRGAINDGELAGDGHGMVLACIGNGCPEAAAFLADRGARVGLVAACGLGRRVAVEQLLAAGKYSTTQLNDGLRYACLYGRAEIVALLVAAGAAVTHGGADGQSPAHQAVCGGHLDVLEILLAQHAPLEQKNVYGGTVLGQALWSARNGGDADRYVAILERLLEAGAQLPAQHAPVNAKIDAFLLSRGSRSA